MKTAQGISTNIKTYFADIADPRNGPAQLHKLEDIIIIAICGILCGADHWTEVAAFGKAKEDWLRQYLALPNGIPSHDTFSRVFRYLDPQAFENRFSDWTKAVHERTAGELIAIDGKCLRGSHDCPAEKAAIYIVSAWAESNDLVLGQSKVAEKSNEITAIPELLGMLDVKDSIVSIDAMGTQKAIAQQIISQAGDYVLALKENQPHLLEDVKSLFTWADNMHYEAMQHDYTKRVNKGHGRIEVRECWTISDPACLAMLSDKAAWAGLQTVVRVHAQRQLGQITTSEERFYISSLNTEKGKLAPQIMHAVRSHWGIENRLHWVLDMSFREDECRVRKDHGDENLAILRHIALNLLRSDKKTKLGVHGKRLKAAWDPIYLANILGFQMR